VSRPPARPAPAAAPRRAPEPAPREASVSAAVDPDPDTDTETDDDLDAYDDEERASRWVALVATIGTALIGIVTVQVLASVIEGITLKRGERVGVPDDLFHRLGYPFGGLGTTALVFLVLGVVLISLPYVLGEYLSDGQDRLVGVAFAVSVAMAVIIAVGSILAVRANLHEYAAKGVAVPSYVRVQFTNFLLGSLGAAALTLYGSLNAMGQRGRERLD
jgi:hypothetical protein